MTKRRDNYLTPDGSVVTREGEVMFFSVSRFIRDICEGNCCFICGASPDDTDFNDEHVIPNWILSELDMHSKTITLPNGRKYRYDRYKVPCCVRCNSLLGKRIEQPVSKLIKGGMEAVAQHLRERGPWLLFIWLALLFLKTHLRDRSLRWHIDARKGALPISEAYDWEEIHHIHCIARAFFAEPALDATTMGTFFAFPASLDVPFENFDYGDLYLHRAVCFRFRDVAMVCILNDSCACFSLEKDNLFPRIKGPLSPLQIREVMARLAYLNLLIEVRPSFHSDFRDGHYVISASRPNTINVGEWEPEEYGRVLSFACSDLLNLHKNPDMETIKEYVRAGRYTFLFDQNGDFITKQVTLVPEDIA
jgi:hypothetical protein